MNIPFKGSVYSLSSMSDCSLRVPWASFSCWNSTEEIPCDYFQAGWKQSERNLGCSTLSVQGPALDHLFPSGMVNSQS